MKRIFSPLFIGVMLINLLSGGALAPRRASAAQKATQDDPSAYIVRLRSRSFTPAEGEVAAGLEAVRQQADSLLAQRQARGQTTDQVFANGRVHALVQLYTIPDQAELDNLAGQGIYLLTYIPEYTWLAALDLNQLSEIAGKSTTGQSSSLRWAGAMETTDKLSPELAQAAGLSDDPEYASVAALSGEVYLTVRFHRDQTPELEQQVLDLYGARLEQSLPKTHRYDIYLPAEQVTALAAEDAVRWLSFGPPEKTTTNHDVRNVTGVASLQASPYGLTGAGVNLGMWDGAPVASHTDFNGRLTKVDSGSYGSTSIKHATHVAGTMAGSGANSTSYSQASGYWGGMAPGAYIYSFDWDDELTEIDTAINTYGVDLSQNSWGYTISSSNCYNYGDYTAEVPDFDAIVTGLYGNKIPIMFAAGNERDATYCGQSTVSPYLNYKVILPPSTAKNVISVGATNSDDDTMTEFSSWGPTDDGRVKPEVVAPGCKKATYNGVSGIISTYYLDNGYLGMCGTSMATPAVSGIVALLIQEYRKVNSGVDPLPSTLKAALVQTADDLNDGTSYYNYGPDYASGYGRVDAKAAVDLIIDGGLIEASLSNGESDSYSVTVASGTSELKISLAWDDEPAAENASKALINDLNLTLTSPSGTKVLPLVLNPSSPSATATTGVDSINNVEQVRVSSPEAGNWKITVSGATVPYGPQTYSLAGAGFSTNTPPNTPAGPTPTDGASKLGAALTMKWSGGDADGDAVTYDVYLGTTTTPTKLKCDNITVLSCATGTLSKGVTYYWRVIATDAKGGETYGPIWHFATTASGVPATFSKTAPGITAVGLLNPLLRWEASSEATSYDYCYAVSTADCTNWTTTTLTSASLSNLAYNTTYYWQVRANGTNGTTYANDSATAYWSFSTLYALSPDGLAKVAPVNDDATILSAPTLQWSAISGASSYQYCLDTSDDYACDTWVSAGAALTRQITSSLEPFTYYYWQVRAVMPSGVIYYANDGAWWSFYTGMGDYRVNLPLLMK